ncbi:MAG: hypothetical protein LBR80_14830 [Deltaproteobacteria bacterium]|nr:hypothetical protein [Deltaproteobacteria bacterium]
MLRKFWNDLQTVFTEQMTQNGTARIESDQFTNPIFEGLTDYMQSELLKELRFTYAKLLLTAKVTGDLEGVFARHRTKLEDGIAELIHETKEALDAYADPAMATAQKAKSIDTARFILDKQIARLAHAAQDLGYEVNPQRAVLLFNIEPAVFGQEANSLGMTDSLNGSMYIAQPDSRGFSAVTGTLAHESEHMVDFALIDIGR